jgi:hypothetical protein
MAVMQAGEKWVCRGCLACWQAAMAEGDLKKEEMD